MTGHKGNSEFCFPEKLNVPRGEASGNIEVEGKQNSLFPEGSVIKDVRAKISNIDFFLKILPLKDDELVMSKM